MRQILGLKPACVQVQVKKDGEKSRSLSIHGVDVDVVFGHIYLLLNRLAEDPNTKISVVCRNGKKKIVR